MPAFFYHSFAFIHSFICIHNIFSLWPSCSCSTSSSIRPSIGKSESRDLYVARYVPYSGRGLDPFPAKFLLNSQLAPLKNNYCPFFSASPICFLSPLILSCLNFILNYLFLSYSVFLAFFLLWVILNWLFLVSRQLFSPQQFLGQLAWPISN